MARFNEIYAGRINRGLQKLTAIKGEPPAPQLASEVQPTLEIFVGRERLIYESWDTWGLIISVAAVAAQFSIAQIRNPVGSNVIGVIEKISSLAQTGCTLNVSKIVGTTTDFTTLLVPRPLDGRNPRPNASLITSSQAQVGGQGANLIAVPAISGYVDLIVTTNQELVLAPGEFINFTNSAVNLGIQMALWWRERFLEDSERSV